MPLIQKTMACWQLTLQELCFSWFSYDTLTSWTADKTCPGQASLVLQQAPAGSSSTQRMITVQHAHNQFNTAAAKPTQVGYLSSCQDNVSSEGHKLLSQAGCNCSPAGLLPAQTCYQLLGPVQLDSAHVHICFQLSFLSSLLIQVSVQGCQLAQDFLHAQHTQC